MTGEKAIAYAWPLLYVIAAPLLLAGITLARVTSSIGRTTDRDDPAAVLVERYPGAWAVLNLTGRWTLVLLLLALLLRQEL